jgi:hypothetical protein
MQETDPALNYVNTHTKEQILFKLTSEQKAVISDILGLDEASFKSALKKVYIEKTTPEEKEKLKRVFNEPIRRNSAGGRRKTLRRRRGKKVRKTLRRRR